MLGRIWQRSNWVNAAVLPLLGALTWSAWGGVLLAALVGLVTVHHANLHAGPAADRLLRAAWAALSLGGVAEASRSAASDQPLQLNRYWVLAALTVVGAIFGLGLLLTSLVTPATVRGWLGLLQPLANLLG